MPSRFRVVGSAVLVGTVIIAVVGLSACSPQHYKVRPEDAAQAIVDIIDEQNDYQLDVADVHCPQDIEATVGVEFDCRFTGRGGEYIAHMRIEKAEGDKVLFAINAGPVDN